MCLINEIAYYYLDFPPKVKDNLNITRKPRHNKITYHISDNSYLGSLYNLLPSVVFFLNLCLLLNVLWMPPNSLPSISAPVLFLLASILYYVAVKLFLNRN